MVALKETKDFLKFVIDLVEAIDKSLEDGDVSIFDAANFVNTMISMGDAFNQIDQIPKELSELTLEQANELYDFVTSELNLNNQNTQEAVKKLLEVGLKIYELVLFVKAARN